MILRIQILCYLYFNQVVERKVNVHVRGQGGGIRNMESRP